MAAQPDRSAPRILGLTGPIACGKSTVGDILLELGALERIDADQLVHELQRPGTPVTQAIVECFGPEVVRQDGELDRARLSQMVFSNPANLRELEAIVHPAVRAETRRRIEALAGQEGIVVVDAVKLLQSDLLPLCEAVWVIQCDTTVERDRLIHNRGMSEEEADARLGAQPDFTHPAVTAMIDNSRSMEELRRRVKEEWGRLQDGA